MVEYYGRLHGLSGEPLRRRMEELFATLQMDHFRDVLGAKMSTGMKQKVSIARALVHDPPILIFDEPTLGLDVLGSQVVVEFVSHLRGQGKAVILTTHRLEEAERLCDRVAILNTTLRAIGRPDELRERLFARTLTVRTRVPLPEPGRVFGGLPAVDGWRQDGPAAYVLAVSEAAVAAPAVTRALVAADADVLSIGEAHHSLEDVYLELIDADKEAGQT